MTVTSWEYLKSDPRLIELKHLSQQVTEIANQAKLDFPRFSELVDLNWFDRAVLRMSSTYTVIIIGQVSSGKSSFINSLLGRRLFVPSDRPTDGVVSVLLSADPGEPERAEKVLQDGTIENFATIGDAMNFLRQQDTPSDQQLSCQEVRLYLHEPWLRQLRIVNTPGLGDRLEQFEKAALQYLHEDESDLVVWTFFPDAAANRFEISVFGDALARRKGTVLGVVTRCHEGKDENETYDPKNDPAFVGDSGVCQWLKRNLGQYLQDVVLYDSHVTRRLVERMRKNPELQSDEAFTARLERSGYAQFQRTLTTLLGPNRERIQEARSISFLKRCSNHAMGLATVVEAAEQVFLQQSKAENDQIAAWQKIEKDIIGPSRSRLKDDVRTLAQERSKELVTIMGNSAADAIEENFGLLGTLGRKIVSWTGICDSASDKLNEQIGNAVKEAINKGCYNERLNEAMQMLMKEHLMSMEKELQKVCCLGNDDRNYSEIPIDAGRPAGGAEGVLEDALSAALTPVISSMLTALAKEIEGRTVSALTEGAGAAAARIGGIVTLVLIPFDIAKLVKDFKKGRQHLSESIRIRYQADQFTYSMRNMSMTMRHVCY